MLDSMLARLRAHAPWYVLTGAGVSVDSGIPAYRDEQGTWQHSAPITYAEFTQEVSVRQRYWLRSSFGFKRVARALPNEAHLALAALERAGLVAALVTQNVDGLHNVAGSRHAIELHGSIHHVICLGCGQRSPRSSLQRRLEQQNPWLTTLTELSAAPDGDANVCAPADKSLELVNCERCGGLLKPDVVFFGEGVPKARVKHCYELLNAARSVLVIGSSLAVFSGYRFVKRGASLGLPVLVVNRGTTRADGFAAAKYEFSCGALLNALAARTAAEATPLESPCET